MNIQKILNRFIPQQHKNQHFCWFLQPTDSSRDYINSSVVWDYYRSNPIIYSCIDLISSLCQEYIIYKQSPLFIKTLVTYLMVFGHCYISKDFQIFNPLDVSVIHKNKSYFYKNQELFLITYNGIDAMSPLEPLMDTLSSYKYIDQFIRGTFKNGGRPAGILYSEDYHQPEQQAALANSFNDPFNPTTKVLFGKYNWITVGSPMNTLNSIAHKEQCIREICACLGIPPSLFLENTHSNLASSLTWLKTYRVIPFTKIIQNQLYYIDDNYKTHELIV